jgi:GNAT superfamily N-acetyltransferase
MSILSEHSGINYIYVKNGDYTHEIMALGADNEIGSIEVDLDDGFFKLGIRVEEAFQGKGLAKTLIRNMVHILQSEGVQEHTFLAIDTDASEGFWEHIGMTHNRYYSRSLGGKIPYWGHERLITLRELSNV